MFAALRVRFKPKSESSVVGGILSGAVTYARHHGSAVLGVHTLLHYLLIAKPVPVIVRLLEAYAVRADPVALQEIETPSGTPEHADYSEHVMKVAARVVHQCQSAGVRPKMINELDILASLALQPQSQQILGQLGLTRLQIIYFRSHGRALPADVVQEIGTVEDPTLPAWVRVDNDHYSTRESVVEVLNKVFEFDTQRATQVLLKIHQYGAVLLGPYEHALARELAIKAVGCSRAAGQPLSVKLSRRGAQHDKAATHRQMWDAFWHQTPGGRRDGLLSFLARHWHGEDTIGIKKVDFRVGLAAWLWLLLLFFALHKLPRDGPIWQFATLVPLLGSIGLWLGVGYWTNARNLRRKGLRPVRAWLIQICGLMILGAVIAACAMLVRLRVGPVS